MIDFRIDIDLSKSNTDYPSCVQLFNEVPVCDKYKNDRYEVLFWGDAIVPEKWNSEIPEVLTVKEIIHAVSGHYYFILRNKNDHRIFIGSSFFSILPLYYHATTKHIKISNRPERIYFVENAYQIDRQFILENILFYYPLFNRSHNQAVSLLPTNHFIGISGNHLHISSHTCVEDLFSEEPVKWRNSIDHISDVFLDSVGKYYPDEFYYNALTGGFDGRTLVASGIRMKKNFSAYSFGSSESSDTFVAENLSKLAGIPYLKIPLDDSYATNHSLADGLDFIINSNGIGSFARAHYLYAIKKLAKNSGIVITGNFGSEVFRTAHIAGAVISPNLHKLFMSSGIDDAIAKLETAPEWNWLNKPAFKHAWEGLKEEINTMHFFNPAHDALSKNQKFYITVFNEVFRKYFGAEMINQFKYVKNRTPFLDLNFFTELLKTELSGVYSDFFTHNPFKRFKGQVAYAHIIKKTYPQFMQVLTDKGYCPGDLLTLSGKLRISGSFFTKKFLSKGKSAEDPYGVGRAYKANLNFWNSINIDQQLFNQKFFRNAFDGNIPNRNSFFVALSQAWYYNQIVGVNERK